MKEPTKYKPKVIKEVVKEINEKLALPLEERISRLERIIKASLSQPSLISKEVVDL